MNTQRIALIRERLQQAFAPEYLEIIDDSEQHKGHKGAEGGAGHYTVVIHAAYFANQSRVTAHREIYRVLNDLIPEQIHALKISIK
jgi:BolA protein